MTPRDVNATSHLPQPSIFLTVANIQQERRRYWQSGYYPSRSSQLYHGPSVTCVCQHNINWGYGEYIDMWWRSDLHPTKCLENCSVCKPTKVEIQTTHGMSLMKTTHLCYKTFATDWEKYDQLLLKNMWYWDWNMIYYQSGDSMELVMLCTTIQTQKNQGYTTWYVIINKIDTAKSFPFMSKHTNPFIWI